MILGAIKERIKTFGGGLSFVFNSVGLVSKGQNIEYSVLQTAHRIEKGLTIRDPKVGWGKEKASSLLTQLDLLKRRFGTDNFSYITGISVLAAYCNDKQKSLLEDDIVIAQQLYKKANDLNIHLEANCFGGIKEVKKDDIKCDIKAWDHIINSRHSIRDYSDDNVTDDEIKMAVNMAMKCPSACNRQPVNVYVIDSSQRKKMCGENSYNANRYIIITGVSSAFSINEVPDWIVNASIFASYLSLSFHVLGIGNCIIRKDLWRNSKYNKLLRKYCSIPSNEQIVLEMALGKYKENFNVAVSNRKQASQVLHIV